MRFSILLLCLLATACRQSQQKSVPDTPPTTFDMEAVKAHIFQMNETYGQRFLKDDTAFYHDRYCRDAMALPPNAKPVNGRDSIMSNYYSKGENKEFKITISAQNIYGNEELVIEEGTYEFPDGKGGSFDNGKFIAIWKQEEGKWKLYREIWSSNNRPAKQ